MEAGAKPASGKQAQAAPRAQAAKRGAAAEGAAAKPFAARQAQKQQQAQAAKKGAGTGSDGMAHALREGPWKLVFNIQNQAAALYNLDDDLAEQKNLIAEPAQAERVTRLTALYRDIRSSPRSTPPLP